MDDFFFISIIQQVSISSDEKKSNFTESDVNIHRQPDFCDTIT